MAGSVEAHRAAKEYKVAAHIIPAPLRLAQLLTPVLVLVLLFG